MRKTLFFWALLATTFLPAQHRLSNDDTQPAEETIDAIWEVNNWYLKVDPSERARPHVYIDDLSELEQFDPIEAQKVLGMTISIGQHVDSTVMENIVPLGKFSKLESLVIKDAPYAPYDFKGLTKLKTLIFDYVYHLNEIPPSIGQLSQLKYLIILGANKIQVLPESIFDLEHLVALALTGVKPQGETISAKISNLQHLEYLKIGYCSFHIPDGIGALQNLRELRIFNYFGYDVPTEAIYQLSKLEILGLNAFEAEQLIGIGKLQSLKVLNLSSDSLTSEIGKLTQLEGLMLRGFKGETYPEEFKALQNLKALKILTHKSLVHAPEFIPLLSKLQHLEFRDCDKLQYFGPAYTSMEAIESIEFQYNDLIKEVPANLSHVFDKVRVKD